MYEMQVVVVKWLNTILLNYSIWGRGLHCKVVLLDSKRAYLFHIHTLNQNGTSEGQNHFDTDFGKCLIFLAKSQFHTTKKSRNLHPKTPSNSLKSSTSSNNHQIIK